MKRNMMQLYLSSPTERDQLRRFYLHGGLDR